MRRLAWLMVPALIVLGCPDPQDDEPTPENWETLELTLAEDSTIAGVAVGYTAELVAESGARKAAEVTLASDLEATLGFTAEDLTATVAGQHTVTATGTGDGEGLTADAPLQVLAADLAEIDLVLETHTAPAGEWVGFEVIGYDTLGNEVDPGYVEITADPEITLDMDDVRGTVVGTFAITATVGLMSGMISDEELLEVVPGEVDDVELTLTPPTIAAGGTSTWSAVFFDAWGNEVPSATAQASCSSPDVTITGQDVTSTVADSYTIRVDVLEGSEPWDGAILEVTAAEPASIDLVVTTYPPEVADPVLCTALILDQYGNECPDSWTLSATAEPGSDINTVVVAQPYLEFTADGWFSAVATVDTNGLEDVEGPFLVDSFGPDITITNPERGAWRNSLSDTATGTITDLWSGVASATINGDPLTLANDGSYSHPLTYDFGITMLETLALDGDGNESNDRRAVLADSFVPDGGGVPDGLVARLNEDAIDSLEGMGEDLIGQQDLGSLLTNPVFHDESESCIFNWCFTWYALTLDVYNPSFSSVDLDLDPQADGSIRTLATAYDLWIDYTASGVVAEIGMGPYNGFVAADSITIAMDLWPAVNNGTISIGISNVSVSSAGFVFDMDSWIYDAANFFGIDVDGMIQDLLEDMITDVVQGEVPAMLEDVLQGLELAFPVELFGNTYTIVAEPYWIGVDDDGLTLSLQSYISPDQWLAPVTGLGSLYAGYTRPGYGPTPGMVLSISDDFLNQALFAFWGGGLLEQDLLFADLGIDPTEFPFLPPNMPNPQIVTSALLPPVVLPGTDSHLSDLQIGDLMLAIYGDDPSDPSNLVLQLYMGLDAGLDITVTPSQTLAANIYDVDAWFDVVYPEVPSQMESSLEMFLDQIIPGLTPLLTDAIGEIEIPAIAGYTLDNISIAVAGAEDGYINAAGDLVGP